MDGDGVRMGMSVRTEMGMIVGLSMREVLGTGMESGKRWRWV